MKSAEVKPEMLETSPFETPTKKAKEKNGLKPKENQPPTRLANFLAFTWHCTKPYFKVALFAVSLVLIQTAVRVLIPLGYQQIFDKAIAQKDLAFLQWLLLLLFGAWTLLSAASFLRDFLSARITAQIMTELRMAMFRKLQALPTDSLRSMPSGDLLARFSVDLASIEHTFAHSIYVVLLSSMVILASVTALFFVNIYLALLIFVLSPLALMGPRLLTKKAQAKSDQRKQLEGKVVGLLKTGILGHTVVKVFGLEESRTEQFGQQVQELAEKSQQAHFLSSLIGQLASQMSGLLQLLIIGIGGYFAIAGAFSAGELFAFIVLLVNIVNALTHLTNVLPNLLQSSSSVQRIQEFLDTPSDPEDTPEQTKLPQLTSTLQYKGVSFGYSPEKPILHDLSFQIRAGESIGIVGSSGSGKSTLLHLLLRLQEPNSGNISLDGVDIRSASKRSLRKQCGVVFQETTLFNGTLRENICMVKPDATQPQLDWTCQQAGLQELIQQLPQGYDTHIGENGKNLSGGQRQRIAIARALLRDPQLLILDEATSALDPITEDTINQTFMEISKTRTVISVTHRLKSVMHMDKILVLDQGQLLEQGSHQELLANKALYYQLWQKQKGQEGALPNPIQGDFNHPSHNGRDLQ